MYWNSLAGLSMVLHVLVLVPGFSDITCNARSVNGYKNKSHIKEYRITKAERKYERRRRKLTRRWGFDVDGFLEQYGYLPSFPNTPHYRKLIHSKLDRKRAIRMYQEMHHLKPSGRVNKRTAKMMREPRCGLPDVRLDDPFSRMKEFHYYKYYPRWRRSILTWRATKYTKKISPLGLWKTLKKGFETWSAVSGVRFLFTRRNPDIQLDFEYGNHGDGRAIAFDGKGGQVAHAFGPGTYTISGDIHFDNFENWTQSINPKHGVNLLAVVIHEIGHALGLQHSKDPRSVMYPTFLSTRLDLTVDDIEKVQILYGPNPDMETDPLLLAKVTTPPPKLCKLAMDDIELGPDGFVYIFRNSYLKQIDKRGRRVRTPDKVSIWEIYKNGPPRVDAVAFWSERKKTYMFHNDTLWRYTNFDLDHGYPKNISGLMPEKPRAGAFMRDQYGITRLLLFGADEFWEWSLGRDKVVKGYPLQTTKYFPGLPRSPTGALRWRDGYIYFFKTDKVYKVHPGSYSVLKGYPKPLPPEWMPGVCR